MLELHPVTVVTITAAFVVGLVLALLGALKGALARREDLRAGQAASGLLLLRLAVVPMVLVAGVCVDQWGVTPVLLLGLAAIAVAFSALALRPSHPRAIAALLLAGLGAAGVNTAAVVLMPQAFFSATQVSASLNLGFVFVALGSLLAVPLTDLLLRQLEWRRMLGVVAAICLLPSLLVAYHGRHLSVLHHDFSGTADVFAQPAVWLAGLVYLFYAPLEAGISAWATSYLTGPGKDERRGSWLLSAFWVAFLASRLVNALVQHSGWLTAQWDGWLLVLPALLAAAVIGNLMSANRAGHFRLGMFALGLLLGPLLPTLLGTLFRSLQEHGIQGNGTAYGVTFALGSVGSMLLAPLIGSAVQRGTVLSPLRIALVLAFALTAATFVYSLIA